jgi:molecular chaperone HtpG
MSDKETLGFAAEVKELLKLVINSLYSHKEIFLRELVSNASDACDKLRFQALSNNDLYENESELQIEISYDKDQQQLIVEDNGIGMSRQEVMDNIGTIARSGTRSFLEKLSSVDKTDVNQIGQFGVGFYSAFIVADKLTLETRGAGLDAGQGVRWESKGDGEYTLETIDKPRCGTRITLHLKEEEKEFLDSYALRNLIHKYSEHISIPIMLPPEDEKAEEQWTQVNKATALWQQPRNDIKDEDYKEFYKTVGHDWQDPLTWLHNRIEGNLQYTLLLYIPAHAPFDLYDRERSQGVKLYVKRVFIMEDTEKLLPNYLRFIRGVIDSDDLPLNVSREILQSSKVVNQINKGATKKVLGMIDKLSQNDEEYTKFWQEFGQVIKEGIVEDASNQKDIAKLLRFASTHENTAAQTTSLADYVGRMQDGQEHIYYIIADTYNAAANSPHLEYFKKQGIEVLLLSDRIDEWVTSHMEEYDGKKLKSAAAADIALDDKDEEAKADTPAEETSILEKIKESLNDKVEDVKKSRRLTDSPACLVAAEGGMTANMERIMKSMGQEVPEAKRILEVNPEHPLVARIASAQADEVGELSEFLFEQSILAEGGKLDNPAAFTRLMNKLIAG